VRAPGPPEHAIDDYSDTRIYRSTVESLPGDGRSAFRIMPIASYAFATRVALARDAQKSLDVQYYLLKDDRTGHALMRELRDAALRGVRVRLLLDDLLSIGEDPILADLTAMPHVEVRLFNPFVNGRDGRLSRLFGALLELGRVDRRMHNKLFIADNAAVVMGGRNIGDEYFMRSAQANFIDMDLFVAGPAVRELSQKFDEYWNSTQVAPLARLLGPAPNLEAASADFERRTADAMSPPPDDLPENLHVFADLPTEVAQGRVRHLIVARCVVLADQPDKSQSSADRNFPTVTRSVLAAIDQARGEVVMVSPYFVPGELGMEMMREAKPHGGRVVLITNSLASTDAISAHAGYIRYRKAMLEAGVEIRELSPSQTRDRQHFGPFGSSSGSLHAKVIVIDRKRVFIGSMNLDFRSGYENTEVGVLIDSSELAAQVSGLIDEGSFYDLRLNADGDVEWVLPNDKSGHVYTADPETNWFERLVPQLLEPVLPEDEL
jgi:putative cardiolipin synthase